MTYILSSNIQKLDTESFILSVASTYSSPAITVKIDSPRDKANIDNVWERTFLHWTAFNNILDWMNGLSGLHQ